MQIDKQTDKIKPCECGHKPDYYTIGYGRTPYSIWCAGCKKSLHDGADDIDIFIGHWNDDYRNRKAPGVMFHLPPNIKLTDPRRA